VKPFLFALKRFLVRPLFPLLLVLCAAAIALSGTVTDVVDTPPAGVCTLSDSVQARRIEAYLLENGFVRSDDPGRLEELVGTGELDCAVILPEDLTELMENGELEGCLHWIQSPSSFAADLYRSHAAAALFREYAPYLTAGVFEGTEIPREEVIRAYERMFDSGHVFSFELLTAEEGRGPENVKRQSLVMGAASILLCAVVFAFCGELTDSAARTMLKRLGLRQMLRGIVLPAMVVRGILAAAAACVGLLLAGMQELMLPAVVYTLLLTGLGVLLMAVLPGTRHLYILLSVLIICSAALCPICTDLALLSPVLAAIRCVLPPWWLWLAAERPLLWFGAAAAAWLAGLVLLGLRYGTLGKYRVVR